jgi:hypothetical protein
MKSRYDSQPRRGGINADTDEQAHVREGPLQDL